MTTLAQVSATVARRTPPDRDRLLDGLRAIALVAVIVGHWLVGGLVLGTDGALRIASPLATFGALAPLTWVLQLLALFFMVGGRVSVRSYRRAPSYGRWLSKRLVRLWRPVGFLAGVLTICLPIAYVAGLPVRTLRTCVVLIAQPLWFIVVYSALTALVPVALWLDRRFGWWAVAACMAMVAIVDLARYGLWPTAGWLSALNLLPGWLFAFQIGIVWERQRPTRRRAWWALVGCATLFAALIILAKYPAAMVGSGVTTRTNANPPSLLVLALAGVQLALVRLLEGPLRALFARPLVWVAVAGINLAAITLLCWHQVAALLVAIVGAGLTGRQIPGLTAPPSTPGWILARIAWLPVLAAVLAALCAWCIRWERAPRRSNVRASGHNGTHGDLAADRARVVLAGDSELVCRRLPGADAGAERGLDGDSGRTAHAGDCPDGVRQDAGGVLVGH